MQTVMSFFEGEGTAEEEAEYTALDTTDLETGDLHDTLRRRR